MKRLAAAGAKNAKAWNGGVSQKLLAWLENELTSAYAAQEPVIVCGHHPLLPPAAIPLLVSGRLRLSLVDFMYVRSHEWRFESAMSHNGGLKPLVRGMAPRREPLRSATAGLGRCGCLTKKPSWRLTRATSSQATPWRWIDSECGASHSSPCGRACARLTSSRFGRIVRNRVDSRCIGICALAGIQGGPGRIAPYRGRLGARRSGNGLRREAATTLQPIHQDLPVSVQEDPARRA